MKCKDTGKEGYIEEEDCHCFCCGVHKGTKYWEELRKLNERGTGK